MLRGASYSPKTTDEATRRNAVATLLGAFEGTADAGHRESFARTLGVIGPDAKAALPALRGGLKDKDPRVRAAAEEAIQLIEPR